MNFARAARTGSRSPRSMTAAAVTGSLISSHSDKAATGAIATALTLTALNTRGQKRLLGACLGRSVGESGDGMTSVARVSIASTVPSRPVLLTRCLIDGYRHDLVGSLRAGVRSWD